MFGELDTDKTFLWPEGTLWRKHALFNRGQWAENATSTGKAMNMEFH